MSRSKELGSLGELGRASLREADRRVARTLVACVLGAVALFAAVPSSHATSSTADSRRGVAASGAAASYTIVTKRYYVARIGPFRPTRDPRLAAALRAFGAASSMKLNGRTCEVRWRRLRLRIDFENFGGAPPGLTTCTPSVGKAQSFTVRGSRFRTARGLRVGQRSSTILDRHPQAEFRDGFWALVLATFPFGGSDEPQPVLSALTRGGRVSAITGYIGGAGE